jgi:hypothetical protein
MDEGRHQGTQGTFESEDTGRKNIQRDKTHGWSAAPEGAASRDRAWASAVNANHGAAELRKTKTAAPQWEPENTAACGTARPYLLEHYWFAPSDWASLRSVNSEILQRCLPSRFRSDHHSLGYCEPEGLPRAQPCIAICSSGTRIYPLPTWRNHTHQRTNRLLATRSETASTPSLCHDFFDTCEGSNVSSVISGHGCKSHAMSSVDGPRVARAKLT